MTDPRREDWGACPPGELERLSARLTFLHRLRIASQAALGVVAVATAAGTAWYVYDSLWGGDQPQRINHPGGTGRSVEPLMLKARVAKQPPETTK